MYCLPQAQLIAQAIGQAFSIAYSQFLQENRIDPSQVGMQPSASASHPHNGDLDHFCNSQNCREVSACSTAAHTATQGTMALSPVLLIPPHRGTP